LSSIHARSSLINTCQRRRRIWIRDIYSFCIKHKHHIFKIEIAGCKGKVFKAKGDKFSARVHEGSQMSLVHVNGIELGDRIESVGAPVASI
jgi:hypothetical protein